MDNKALIFDIKRDCSEDGPGIRTTVFFKGCPLSCVWCQNPEGLEKKIDLLFNNAGCHPQLCDAPCTHVCPASCLTSTSGEISLNRESCTQCRRCIDVCKSGALQQSGYWITLDNLLYRLLIDKPFYQSSGGGVTLSGGEVTQQMLFAHRLLKALKDEAVHTAIETSGFFNYRRFHELMLPWLDIIYFDLKLIDDTESQRYAGQTNSLILENFSKLVKSSSVPVIPRVPLIPGITTTETNLTGIADFLSDHGIDTATLLPYNPLWTDKAIKLDRDLHYRRAQFMTTEEQQLSVDRFHASNKFK